jgi:hypothetical protein
MQVRHLRLRMSAFAFALNAGASVFQVGAQQAVGASRAQIIYATGMIRYDMQRNCVRFTPAAQGLYGPQL